MDDISVVEVQRPVSAQALTREVERIQAERSEEIQALRDLLDGQEEQDPALESRLEELQSINGTQDAERILAESTVKIALRSVTRRQSFRRANLIEDSRRWLADRLGVSVDDLRGMDGSEMETEHGAMAYIMFQAADIMVALVPERCEGWDVPRSQEEWCDVPDWLFTQALTETWALNPQFVISPGEI